MLGPVAAISAGFDIKEDINKYNGREAFFAAGISVVSTGVNIGAGVLITAGGAALVTAGTPVILAGGAVIVAGGVVGYVVGELTNAIKSKLFGG